MLMAEGLPDELKPNEYDIVRIKETLVYVNDKSRGEPEWGKYTLPDGSVLEVRADGLVCARTFAQA